MKRLLFIAIVFSTSLAFAGSGYTPVDGNFCGLHPSFTSAYCGNVGTFSAPGGATDMTGAGLPYSIASSGTYKLTANGGADATACQISAVGTYASKVTIYLGGFALTGRLCLTGNFLGGLELYYGAVTCAKTGSGSDTGCVRFEENGGTITATNAIHHLTVDNTQDPGANSAAGMQIVLQPTSYTGGGNLLSLYNLTVTTHTGTSSNRIQAININGKSSGGTTYTLDAYNLLLTGAADSSADQGIVLFCMNGISVVHNSVITMVNNTTAQSGRGVTFDGDGGTGCSGLNVLKDSIVTPNNNRGFRQRTSKNDLVANVQFVNVTSPTGAVYAGDQTNTTDEVDANLWVINSTFDIAAGTGFWGRGQTGNTGGISNNTATCSLSGCPSGKFVAPGLETGSMTGQKFNLFNNVVAATIGSGSGCTGGSSTNSCAPAAATLNLCNSGTASGSGTVVSTTCP